jgi:hypothetical protein
VGHSGHSIIIALMMGTEMVPETLDFNELTRLSAREEFINFSHRESFTSYTFEKLNDAYGKYYHLAEHLAVDEVIVLFKTGVILRYLYHLNTNAFDKNLQTV